MKSPTTNTTLQFPQKQPQNGRYGRFPLDLLPIILKLSNFEAKVFTFATILANFKRHPIGRVDMSFSALAKQVGTSRGSLRRALKALEEHGLITQTHGSPGSNGWITVTHYLECYDPPPGSPRPTKSPQPQPSIGSCEPPIRSEEVSEEEVKKKRGKRSAKASPPHLLSEHVRWDKEGRRIRFSPQGPLLIRSALADLVREEKLGVFLSEAEMQEGLGRLNGHLMGNPFKTNPKTLPAIVLNWFETDLRRKNNNPQRGKPLAQRIDEKTRERMNDGIEESGQSDNGFTQQLLESGDFRRHS